MVRACSGAAVCGCRRALGARVRTRRKGVRDARSRHDPVDVRTELGGRGSGAGSRFRLRIDGLRWLRQRRLGQRRQWCRRRRRRGRAEPGRRAGRHDHASRDLPGTQARADGGRRAAARWRAAGGGKAGVGPHLSSDRCELRRPAGDCAPEARRRGGRASRGRAARAGDGRRRRGQRHRLRSGWRKDRRDARLRARPLSRRTRGHRRRPTRAACRSRARRTRSDS